MDLSFHEARNDDTAGVAGAVCSVRRHDPSQRSAGAGLGQSWAVLALATQLTKLVGQKMGKPK